MAKAGSTYEKVVADIISTLSPGAKAQYGQWIIGPDGRRDLDVEIRGQINGEEQFVLLECKDWKNTVGIGIVDALDSKRRDLSADYALICSNSGFTSDALRKGKRVGIGMVAALKSGDQSIKVVIEEEIYVKKIHIKEYKSTWYFSDSSLASRMPKNLDPHSIRYKGLFLTNWVADESIFLVEANPNATKITSHYKLLVPDYFEFSSVILPVLAFDIHLIIETLWTSQIVSIDSSKAIHDFIQHKTIMPVGTPQQIKISGFDIGKLKAINFKPSVKPLDLNESRISFSIYENAIAKLVGTDTPNIGSLISEKTLTVDNKILKRDDDLLRKDGSKVMSGIEMLVNPIQGERIKLGRNESCYCGSGKKYMKCHGT